LRAEQTAIVPEKYIAPFVTNTKPERIVEKHEIEEIKSLFINAIDKLQIDFEEKIFNSYTPSPNILKVYG